MELLKLSKFKLQLRALISEVRQLKDPVHQAVVFGPLTTFYGEKEQSDSHHLQLTIRKQKQIEEEFDRKLAELHAELGSSNDLRHKLERKVSCLENENNLLENKQKELEGTIRGLLESKEAFVKAYEDSTYEMKRAIEDRGRKINILSEKLKAHLALFESISKEASSIHQVMDDVRQTLSQKEDVVAGLKRKMDEVSTFEKLFVEKINNLESNLANNEMELTKKTKRILELEAELEAAILSKEVQPKIMQLQKDVSTKELLLQNLISENKGLQCEVGSLGIVIKKIQDAVTRMSEEDRKTFTSMLEGQEECLSTRQCEKLSVPAGVQITGEERHPRSSMIEESTASPEPQEHLIKGPLKMDNKINCYAAESVNSSSRSACSLPQFETDHANISASEAKEDCTELVNQLDLERSTTQVEML